jgi:molybdopterin adenylyltransferase
MTDERPIIGILTISDRASRGEYEDLSGPAIEEVLRQYLATDCRFVREIVADGVTEVEVGLRDLEARGACLICTTGGTGPSARDLTPEAIERVATKLMPGFGEAMRAASLASGVPTAILSRQTAAIMHHCLVITLPGKPAAIRVCLDAVFPAVPYCIDLIGGPYLEGDPKVVEVFRPLKK